MCMECVKVDSPDRGNLCLESGVYLANLVACLGCGRKDTIIAKDSSETFSNGDDTQEIVFKHVCSECDHLVAEHHYLFWVSDGYQNYEMNCCLCGEASDERSCLPDDPRKEAMLF